MENNSHQVANNSNYCRIYLKRIRDTSLVGVTFKIGIKNCIKSGVPHLFEHLLVNQIFKFKNIIVKGSTTERNISIVFLGEKNMMDKIIPVIVDKITNLSISIKQLNFEKKVVNQEILEYQVNNLQRFAIKARNKTFGSDRLTNDKVLGTQEELDTITVTSVNKFIENNVYSENMRIFIVGKDIDKYYSIFKQLYITKNGSNKKQYLTTKSHISNFKNKTIFLNEKNSTTKLARISYIKKLSSNELYKDKILALSLLFSELTSGKNALLKILKEKLGEVYFVKIIPIYYNDEIYIQFITSCFHTKTVDGINYINYAIHKLVDLDEDDLENAIINLKLHQNLLFDGVLKSVQSFASMEEAQEDIVNIEDINKQKIKTIYRKLIDFLIVNKDKSVVVEYE